MDINIQDLNYIFYDEKYVLGMSSVHLTIINNEIKSTLMPNSININDKKTYRNGETHYIKCPECGEKFLVIQSGCVLCIKCGWSYCN